MARIVSARGRSNKEVQRPEQIIVNPCPDWDKVYTAAEINDDFVDFKFNGPGWYINADGSAMLVARIEMQEMPWIGKFSKSELFRAYVYNRANVMNIFNAIAFCSSKER